MHEPNMVAIEPSATAQGSHSNFFLCVMFAGSGLSALIYEIVWFQLLQQVIGASAVSLGVLLGTFMGGMCLGSLALPWWNPWRRHPLRVYAFLELGIALFALAMLPLMPYVNQLYIDNVASGSWSLALRASIAALCLLPPTILMGATLPAIARWVETSSGGVAGLGLFYGANIAGGVAGSLLAGFYLLRVHDMVIATGLAVMINVIVAMVALWLARAQPYSPIEYNTKRRSGEEDPLGWTIYMAIGISGTSALGAEVLWTRFLSLILGATTYTFSIILAVFLVGLGIGSSVASTWSNSMTRPRLLFAWTQILLAWSIVWASVMLTQSIPYWPIDPSLSRSPWLTFQLDIVRTAWAILPAACLWGASFPLALASLSKSGRDPSRLVAGVYSANTIGAIAGALCFSLFVIRGVGTMGGQKLLVILALVSSTIILFPLIVGRLSDFRNGSTTKVPQGLHRQKFLAVVSIGISLCSFLLMRYIHEMPYGLVAYGRYIATWFNEPSYLYMGEGMNSSIAVSEDLDGSRSFHVSGKTVASSKADDMRLQRMLGHLPAFLHPKPKSVLIVGCGAGVTAGTFMLHPSIERIVICEIEPLIPPAANKYFGNENHHVMEDPRVELVFDDAKHYIRTTTEKFDIITSDPIHPWVKGAASLYTREYYEQVLLHLKPGGIVTQWVPFYETSLDAVRSEVATFFDAFPEGSIWANESSGQGYDTVMLGQSGPMLIDYEQLEKRMQREDSIQAQKVMAEVGLGNPLRLMLTYAGRKKELAPWLEKAEINRDRTMRLQYLAGLSSNTQDADAIYQSMLTYRVYPRELFSAPNVPKRALQAVLNNETKLP